MDTIGICISIAPVVLFAAAALGILGYMPLGPREMPREDPTNRKMGVSFLMLSLGLLGAQISNSIVSAAGIALGLVAIVLYGYLFYKARKQHPAISDKEYIAQVRQQRQDSIDRAKARRLKK